MKKIVFLAFMICLACTVQAQSYGSRGTQSAQAVTERLEKLVDQFCKYVEMIGSTQSVSDAEKDRIRREEVPDLFYRYKERKMITTAGTNGAIKGSKKMSDYFRRLQTQSKTQSSLSNQTVITYDLAFVFACSDGQLKWAHSANYEDGTKEYESKVLIYQTYLKETKNGVETVRMRREVDKKEMVAKKLVLPNGNELLKLGDITGAERLETASK